MTDIYNYNPLNKSLTNIYVDNQVTQPPRLRHRRSFDYGYQGGYLAGPNTNVVKNPIYNINIHNDPISSNVKPSILIRRQSSERCLQKRHSVDSNKSNISDPGSFVSNKTTGCLMPAQQRSPRESNSPKSMYSSAASVNVKNCSYSSMLLSREGSINSSQITQKRQSSDQNLDNNRKWYSSSSVILTRVKSMKEKFRRVVVQSVQPDDWPPPSVLFSDRYRYPSTSSTNTNPMVINSNIKAKRASFQNMKSKSIDQAYSNCNIISSRKPNIRASINTVNSINTNNIANTNAIRQNKRGRLQRSMTTYEPENGIVCTEMDLKDIITNFKREELNNEDNDSNGKKLDFSGDKKVNIQQFISKTPTSSCSSIGPGFGKRKLMRKQVSFDDEQGVMVINRKVSAIAEEIECHNLLSDSTNVSGSCKEKENIIIKNTDRSQEGKEEIELNETTLPASQPKFTIDSTVDNEKQLEIEKESIEVGLHTEDQIIPLLPKEIEFDEFGQTWEVYGADPDPEILGQAIQSHLERLMLCRQNPLPNGSANRHQQSLDNNQKKSLGLRTYGSRSCSLTTTSTAEENSQLRLLVRRLCSNWSCLSPASPAPASANAPATITANTISTTIPITKNITNSTATTNITSTNITTANFTTNSTANSTDLTADTARYFSSGATTARRHSNTITKFIPGSTTSATATTTNIYPLPATACQL